MHYFEPAGRCEKCGGGGRLSSAVHDTSRAKSARRERVCCRGYSLFLMFVALSLMACGSTGAAEFRTNEFVSHEWPLTVGYHEDGSQNVLDREWRLENFSAGKRGELARRTTTGQKSDYYLTSLDDEKPVKATLFAHELEFRNERTDAEIWLRVVPLPQALKKTELRVLVERIQDGATGSGTITMAFGADATVSIEKRYAANALEVTDVTLDGWDGIDATFEIADLDQLALEQGARRLKARLVLVRPTELSLYEGGKLFPVLVQIGYSGRPRFFDESMDAFEGLVRRVRILSTPAIIQRIEGEVAGCAEQETTVRFVTTPEGEPILKGTHSLRPRVVSCLRRAIAAYRFPHASKVTEHRVIVSAGAPPARSSE